MSKPESAPYLDAEGNVDGALAAVRIIDERVEAEKTSQGLTGERFEAVVANSPSAISVRISNTDTAS